MKIYFPIKLVETGEEITLIKNTKTGKHFWWNLTKGCFFFGENKFIKYLREYSNKGAEE